MTEFEIAEEARKSRPRIRRRRRSQKAWILRAVDYWSAKVSEMDIGCDWDEADVRCWRCGYLRSCQMCHIVAKSLGGSDDVDNIIPLCAECHDEMPNVIDPAVVWHWIKADHGQVHETYWTLRAIAACGLGDEFIAKNFCYERFKEFSGKSAMHFGQLHGRARRSTETLAWVIRKACGL